MSLLSKYNTVSNESILNLVDPYTVFRSLEQAAAEIDETAERIEVLSDAMDETIVQDEVEEQLAESGDLNEATGAGLVLARRATALAAGLDPDEVEQEESAAIESRIVALESSEETEQKPGMLKKIWLAIKNAFKWILDKILWVIQVIFTGYAVLYGMAATTIAAFRYWLNDGKDMGSYSFKFKSSKSGSMSKEDVLNEIVQHYRQDPNNNNNYIAAFDSKDGSVITYADIFATIPKSLETLASKVGDLKNIKNVNDGVANAFKEFVSMVPNTNVKQNLEAEQPDLSMSIAYEGKISIANFKKGVDLIDNGMNEKEGKRIASRTANAFNSLKHKIEEAYKKLEKESPEDKETLNECKEAIVQVTRALNSSTKAITTLQNGQRGQIALFKFMADQIKSATE